MKCLMLAVALSSALASSVWAAETPAKPILPRAPIYPSEAKFRGREGWVFIESHVTAEGNVADVKVITSYPVGVFDDVAIESARKYKFTPKLVDGVPTEEPSYKYAYIFTMVGGRGVSKLTFEDFKQLVKALNSDALGQAADILQTLRTKLETGKFNLTEVARYYQFAAHLAVQQQDHLKTAEYADYALRLASYLDNKEVVDVLHFQMVGAFFGLQQYHNAVDYFDSWRKDSAFVLPAQSQKAIDELRQKGFGRGRVFGITSYDEAMGKKKTPGTRADFPDPQNSTGNN